MSGYKIQPVAGLHDPNSGALVGFMGANGKEYLLASTQPDAGGNAVTPLPQGDQECISQDPSYFRTGSWSVVASGALYALLGDFAMYYWTHNVALDANGNFMGRDEAGTCQLWAFTESGIARTYNAVTAAAGVVPVWSLVKTETLANGSVALSGNVATAGHLISYGTLPTPACLHKTGIPVGIAPSGTLGNNGALTLGTALNTTYSGGIWLALPAGAIAVGSASGIYWVVMSSTTLGTVYNNTYSGVGAPTPPATPTPFLTTGPGAYTGITTFVQLGGVSVPANYMGPNGQLRISCGGPVSNTAGIKYITPRLGAAVYTAGGTLNSAVFGLDYSIANQNATNAQVAVETGSYAMGIAASYSAVDTTQAQTLALYGTLAVATDYMIINLLLVELLSDGL